jgi:uncharacterized delta-60 repeat protein
MWRSKASVARRNQARWDEARRRSNWAVLRCVVLAEVEALEARRLLSAGQLDPTFGNGGVVLDNTHPGANAVVVQSDGKVVEAGLANYGGQAVLSLARFNANGTPDTTFGYFGGLTQVLGVNGIVGRVALQSDGKILVSAESNDQTFIHAVSILNRYLPNGQLDPSFGSGGEVTIPFTGTDTPIGIVVQADGEIVTGDSQIVPAPFGALPSPVLQLARFNTNGSLDTNYGVNGIVSKPQAHLNSIFTAMALEPDGRVVVIGNAADGAVLIDRFTSAGALDGTVFATTGLGGVTDVATQADGKIVVSRDRGSVAVTRFNLDGTIDSNFGTNGSTVTGQPLTFFHYDHLLVQADGKIVVSGSENPEIGDFTFLLARFNADGSFDGSFGAGGQTQIPAVPANAGAHPSLVTPSIALAPAGGIVVAGGRPDELVLARVSAPVTQPGETPFGGTPATVPGQVEAENFDNGGEGVGYHTGNPVNFTAGLYRNTGVSIEPTGDAGGGFDVGWLHAGDYLNYTVNVANAGNYDLAVRVANASAGGSFHVQIDGNSFGSAVIPNTGGFQVYTTVTLSAIPLTAGLHVVKLMMDTNSIYGFAGNLNWFKFTPGSGIPGRSISGTVYNDANRNGVRDPAETAVAGRQVYLDLNGIDLFVAGDPIAVTDASGGYSFTGLAPGNYLVRLVPVPGKVTSAPLFGGKFFVQLGTNQQITGDDFGTLDVTSPNLTLPDGKLLVANPFNTSYTLTRYNPDGSTDTTFGTLGTVNLGAARAGGISQLLLRPDGNVVARLDAFNPSSATYHLLLLDPSGAVLHDVVINFQFQGQQGIDTIEGVAVAPDNKIIVAYQHDDPAPTHYKFVRRYNADFTLDTSFGNNGQAIVTGAPIVPLTSVTPLANGQTVLNYGGTVLTLSSTGAVI